MFHKDKRNIQTNKFVKYSRLQRFSYFLKNLKVKIKAEITFPDKKRIKP